MIPPPAIDPLDEILRTILQAHERRFVARETRIESPESQDADDFDLSDVSDLRA